MTSASWCSGTGSCLVLSSSWSLSTIAITQLRHLATFAHSLSWKSQMHNQQSRSVALITSVSYSHCLPLRLWGRAKGFYFILFAQSKLRKAERSKGNVWKDILRLLLTRFHCFKLSLSSPELLQVTDVLTLFLCGCVCWRGVGEYIFWIFSS